MPTCPIPSFSKERARVFLDVRADRGVASSWGVETKAARIYECPASGLRFRLPVPREEILAYYGAEYHQKMVGTEEDRARTHAYRLENEDRIAHLKRYRQKGRVMDIGCSTGLLAGQLRDAGYEALGSDISAWACEEAAKLLGTDNVFCGHVEALAPKLEGSLDAITMMDVIEHFEDIVTPLRALRTMLKPGGILFLRTPTLSSPFYKVADLSYRLSAGRYKNAILKIYHAEHFYFFTEKAISALLADTGYRVLEIAPDPLLWENFRSAEMRQGPAINGVLAGVYFAGRMVHLGHGMKVVAERVE